MLIVLAKPACDYKVAFRLDSKLPPEFDRLYFYSRGRDALLVALRAFGVISGDTVVIPAYICDSTIQPLRQAGYRIAFVDIKGDFQLDLDKVLEAVEIWDAKAVLAIHYFGFSFDIGRLVALLRPRGVRVIEDCCHSFLTNSDGRRIGSDGDAAIFSMRKTLPVPDGGSLRMNVQDFDRAALTARPKAAPAVGRYLVSRAVESMAVAVGWPNIYSLAIDKFRRRIRGGRGGHGDALHADLEPRQQGPSKLLASYLSNEDYLRRVSSRTAANYASLVEGALALGLQPYMPQLSSGCVPQWAPMDDPSGRIVPWLREHGVGACRWPWYELPTEVASVPSSYPISNELNFRLALMPVHQSIGPRQMARMLHLLGQFLNRPTSTSYEKTFE